MTIQKIYAIFDSKVGVFLRPFFAPCKGQVMRDLSEIVNVAPPPAGQKDERHVLARHAGDFTLFELGTFDDTTAVITPCMAPERVFILHELVSYA